MRPTIRGGLAAVGLMINLAQMADAAYTTPQQTTPDRQVSRLGTSEQADSAFLAQAPAAPAIISRPGIGVTKMPVPKLRIQSGNDFNWAAGG